MNSTKLNSILLVDDDSVNNFLNKIFIEKLDLNVEVNTALNGKEALGILGNKGPYKGDDPIGSPCLLILDIKMPVMNGWEFLEAYDKEFSEKEKDNVVIVMITISDDEKDEIQAKNNPYVKEFIQKPLSDVKFADLIHKHFAN